MYNVMVKSMKILGQPDNLQLEIYPVIYVWGR